MKISSFPCYQNRFQPGMKIWSYARPKKNLKIEMAASQAHFKLTDDKVKLYESVRKGPNRYI